MLSNFTISIISFLTAKLVKSDSLDILMTLHIFYHCHHTTWPTICCLESFEYIVEYELCKCIGTRKNFNKKHNISILEATHPFPQYFLFCNSLGNNSRSTKAISLNNSIWPFVFKRWKIITFTNLLFFFWFSLNKDINFTILQNVLH